MLLTAFPSLAGEPIPRKPGQSTRRNQATGERYGCTFTVHNHSQTVFELLKPNRHPFLSGGRPLAALLCASPGPCVDLPALTHYWLAQVSDGSIHAQDSHFRATFGGQSRPQPGRGQGSGHHAGALVLAAVHWRLALMVVVSLPGASILYANLRCADALQDRRYFFQEAAKQTCLKQCCSSQSQTVVGNRAHQPGCS